MNTEPLATATTTACPPPDGEARRRWRPLLLLSLLLLPVTFGLGVHLPELSEYLSKLNDYPLQMDAEEGFILAQAMALSRGESIYTPIDEPPFVVGNYPPLMPWLYSRILGPAPRPDLPAGRRLMTACLWLTLALLVLTVGWQTRNPLPALLAPLLFAITYEVYHWTPFVRVDMPAIALTMAGWAVLILGRARRGALLGAALLWVAAAYTRQTAIFAPLALCLAVAWTSRRALLWSFLPWAAGGLSIIALLSALTGGEAWRHLVTYNRNAMDWHAWGLLMRNEVWFFHRWQLLAMLALILGACAAGWMVPGKKKTEPIEPTGTQALLIARALGIYLLLATISLLLYAKIGAAPNYVLEPLLAWGLVGTIGWHELSAKLLDMKRSTDAQPRWRCGAVLLCLLAMAGCWAAHARRTYHLDRILITATMPDPGKSQWPPGLWERFNRTSGPIYSEEPIYALMLGQAPVFQPFIMSQLAREGRWDPSPWLAMIESQRFEMVLVREDFWTDPTRTDYERYTPEMAAAFREHYQRIGQLNDRPPTWILFPRSEETQP